MTRAARLDLLATLAHEVSVAIDRTSLCHVLAPLATLLRDPRSADRPSLVDRCRHASWVAERHGEHDLACALEHMAEAARAVRSLESWADTALACSRRLCRLAMARMGVEASSIGATAREGSDPLSRSSGHTGRWATRPEREVS